MASHRYWSVRIDSLFDMGRHCAVATEIQFYSWPIGPRLTDVGGVPFASSDFGGAYVAGAAFDNNTDTFWHDTCGAFSSAKRIGWDWGADPANWQEPLSFGYIARPDGYSYSDSIKTGGLEWSDDGANWTRVWSIPEQVNNWAPRERRVFVNPAIPSEGANVGQISWYAIANEIPPASGGAGVGQIVLISVGQEYEIPKKPDGRLVRAIWGNPLYIEKG